MADAFFRSQEARGSRKKGAQRSAATRQQNAAESNAYYRAPASAPVCRTHGCGMVESFRSSILIVYKCNTRGCLNTTQNRI